MKILIVGAGAIGGLFGAFLHRHGTDLQFLLRPARKMQIDAEGLGVGLPSEQLHIQPRTLTVEQLGPDYDLVILSNKAYALDAVIADVAPAIGEHTLILPLLNGLRHLEVLDRAFGQDRVLGGIAMTVATLSTPTQVQVSNAYSSLTLGARLPEQRARVEAIRHLLGDAGIDCRLSDDILGAMWDKFCRMAALGAANCLLQGTVGEYMQSGEGGDIARQLFGECTATADAAGHPLDPQAIRSFERALTNPKSSFNSSMYRDMQAGLPIEGQHLVGDMLRRGQAAGIPCPLLTVANAVLETYSARQ